MPSPEKLKTQIANAGQRRTDGRTGVIIYALSTMLP